MNTNFLASKPRFEILDGLRGVAAILVVMFHLFETYSKGPCFQILNHGYLAVDFFFILSGFVIGYAYDDRWKKGMTQWNFYKRRLIRLQPMVIMGTLIGAICFYFGDAPFFTYVMQTPWWKLLIIVILGCLMFPTPPSMDIRGWSEVNSLNGVTWSLMWEYIGNILYATIIRRFSKVVLTVFVELSAILTISLGLDIDWFGLLEGRDSAAHTMIGGFGLTPDQLYIGLTRLLYPFFGGLLMYRLGISIKIKNYGFLWCSLALAAILVMPHLGGDIPNMINGSYCVVAILLLFPMIVAAGAGSPLEGEKTIKVCKFLGAISYPLYITHYPLVYMQMQWVAAHPDAPEGAHVWVFCSLLVASIAVAYACLKLYDEPVREWLKNHWLHYGVRSKY
jgi:hypothetical protein